MDKPPLILTYFQETLWLQEGLSQATQNSYISDLKKLHQFLKEQHIELERADKLVLQTYLDTKLEQGITPRSIARFISSFKHFYTFLIIEKIREDDPTIGLITKKFSSPLPATLTEEKVEALLAIPDTKTYLGLRDRAMLELLYSCGFRVSELVNLTLSQLHLKAGYVRIIGKGNKERLIPIGEEALDWLSRYLENARPQLVHKNATDAVFVSNRGDFMTRQTFWHIIKNIVKQLEINPNISPHTLRHAFATHLVNHGADLRVVQLLLGHSSLSTTQIYTHIAKERLKSLHQQHHPRG